MIGLAALSFLIFSQPSDFGKFEMTSNNHNSEQGALGSNPCNSERLDLFLNEISNKSMLQQYANEFDSNYNITKEVSNVIIDDLTFNNDGCNYKNCTSEGYFHIKSGDIFLESVNFEKAVPWQLYDEDSLSSSGSNLIFFYLEHNQIKFIFGVDKDMKIHEGMVLFYN